MTGELDEIDRELLGAAFRGRVFYDSLASHDFTLDGEDVDVDTKRRLELLVEDGFLEYFQNANPRHPDAPFLTSVVTTSAAWPVMSR